MFEWILQRIAFVVNSFPHAGMDFVKTYSPFRREEGEVWGIPPRKSPLAGNICFCIGYNQRKTGGSSPSAHAGIASKRSCFPPWGKVSAQEKSMGADAASLAPYL